MCILGMLLASCQRQRTAADLEEAPACKRVPISYESDGLKVTGLVSKPEGLGVFPLIIVNHGGFEPAEKVAGFADFFAAAGFFALAPDYRGCGKSEGKHELANSRTS